MCLDWFHEKQSLEEEGGSGDHGDPILLILCGVTGGFHTQENLRITDTLGPRINNEKLSSLEF